MANFIEHPLGIKYRSVEASLLGEDVRGLFVRRQAAIMMRLDGHLLKDIYSETGVSNSEVVRLLERFRSIDDEGICYGELALIPYQRISAYKRIKPIPPKGSEQKGGMAGAMGLLLRTYPEIYEKFVVKVMSLDDPLAKGSRFQKRILCDEFYKICRSEGIAENEWPLNQQRASNRTVIRLIDDILCSDFSRGATSLGGTNAHIHAATGVGIEPLLCNIDVLDALEIDSHFLDGIFVLNLKGDQRLTTQDVISRFWLISARCKRSKAIFAARYVFSSEVTAQDIFGVICDAFLGNWRPRESFSFEDLAYLPGAGMPAYVYPKLKHHCITAIYFDNAMQHYAKDVKRLCSETLGTAIDYGPLNLPSRRNAIEGLFKIISHRVLHSLSSTTGSNPFDGRSEEPEKAAVSYNINVDEAIEVLDCYIANFNATPNGGTNKANSPLDAIAAYLDAGDMFIPSMPSALVNMKGVGLLIRRVRVQGKMASGIRPRIKLDKALYTSRELANMPQLIGEYVYVKIDAEDYRKVLVYLENGVELCELTVEAAWREYKHSVQTRKIINRALDKKVFLVAKGQSPIVAYRNHLIRNRSAEKNRALVRLDYELGCPLSQAFHSIHDARAYDNCPANNSSSNQTSKSCEIVVNGELSSGERKERPKWEVMNEFNF